MRYAGTSIALLAVLFGLAVGLLGQHGSAASHAGAVQLESTLGDATVALSGPWKFHVGDNIAWRQQDFDDFQTLAFQRLSVIVPPFFYPKIIESMPEIGGRQTQRDSSSTTDRGYSQRSATMGSTRIARRAGR